MPKTTPDYSQLNTKLETILEQLQQPDVGVHEAVILYEKGLKITAELEEYLSAAENTIEKLNLSVSPDK